jgi:hypothetical protein
MTMTSSTNKSARSVPGLFGLCILLWLAGAVFSISGALLLISGTLPQGAVALGIGLLSAAAGIGLYRLRRWGVILFGILGLLGSVNHLANILLNYSDLSQAGLGEVFTALFRILIAIIIPIGLIYLFLLYWRNTE